MESAFQITAKKDHYGAKVGMQVFLITIGMLFLSLFMAYTVLRSEQESWPPIGSFRPEPLLPILSTLALALSSFCLHKYQQGKIKKIVLSGGNGNLVGNQENEAVNTAAYLKRIGISTADIIIDEKSTIINKAIKTKRFIIIVFNIFWSYLTYSF